MRFQKHSSVQVSRRVALVTGAASTLGTAICLKLAQQGVRIALHYGESLKKTKILQRNLSNYGVETLLIRADLSRPQNANFLIRAIIHRWGRLDLLVNNASLFQPTPLEKIQWELWKLHFTINVLTPFALSMAAEPWLKSKKGSIVNLADIYGELPVLWNHAAYSSSKASLLFLTKFLAVELGPNIRVNAVSPGVISFPPHYPKIKRKLLIQRSSLKRQGNPMEVAEAVWFLATHPFITGQILKVDGGRFMA